MSSLDTPNVGNRDRCDLSDDLILDAMQGSIAGNASDAAALRECGAARALRTT